MLHLGQRYLIMWFFQYKQEPAVLHESSCQYFVRQMNLWLCMPCGTLAIRHNYYILLGSHKLIVLWQYFLLFKPEGFKFMSFRLSHSDIMGKSSKVYIPGYLGLVNLYRKWIFYDSLSDVTMLLLVKKPSSSL